jgi:drug/metabolite transporter (DMT)-like permease
VDEIAATLALLAAVAFALAATLWQKAALSLADVSARHPKSFLVLLTQWVWLLGLAAQILGVVLQAAALDRGRVSIIQPLLVTTVIWALPLGYFLTHQTIGGREVSGAAIIVVGLALFAAFGDPAAGVDDAPGSDWAAAILVISTACVALLLFANRGSLSTRAALLGTIAGMLYGLSATLMKPVVENLHAEGLGDVMAGWEFWVWAAAGVIGFVVQQLSLSTGRLVPSVATVSVANPVVSVMLGALVLQERLDKNPPSHAVVAVGALCLALLGAVVISSAREQERDVEQTVTEDGTARAEPLLG